eukprot:1196080-Prorocentrum_minimum.AAC.6
MRTDRDPSRGAPRVRSDSANRRIRARVREYSGGYSGNIPPVDQSDWLTAAQGRSAVARSQPVNVGVKVFHGENLELGLQFFDSFLATYWELYLSKGNFYGLNEQLSVADMLLVGLQAVVKPLLRPFLTEEFNSPPNI